MPTMTFDALDSVVGGFSVPRPVPQEPRQPENFPFFGPYVDPDLTYKPDPDKGPPVIKEPDPGYAPYGATERDASLGSPSNGDDSMQPNAQDLGGAGYDETLPQMDGIDGSPADSYDTTEA